MLGVIGVVVLLVAIVIVNKQLAKHQSSYNNYQIENSDTKITRSYKSKILKISIETSEKFTLEEKFGTIYLKQDNNLITIDRVGTNLKTVDEYLDQLSKANKVLIANREHVEINGLDSVKAIIKHPNTSNPDNKAFFFYINYGVYDISTTSESLFSDLDQIAQSFRYTP